jgi:hypothetical protein
MIAIRQEVVDLQRCVPPLDQYRMRVVDLCQVRDFVIQKVSTSATGSLACTAACTALLTYIAASFLLSIRGVIMY